jgi:hypothetical protein
LDDADSLVAAFTTAALIARTTRQTPGRTPAHIDGGQFRNFPASGFHLLGLIWTNLQNARSPDELNSRKWSIQASLSLGEDKSQAVPSAYRASS